jgi:hypothetical protein
MANFRGFFRILPEAALCSLATTISRFDVEIWSQGTNDADSRKVRNIL